MTEIEHTPEDAAILLRTRTTVRTLTYDWTDAAVIRWIESARGDYEPEVMRRCLAAQGYRGQEWLDLMDELAGRVSA